MTTPIRGGSALWAVQVAVFQALTQDGTLAGLLAGGVFDSEPPEDQRITLPYILIGEMTEVPADRLTTTGNDITFLLHVYSNYNGMKEASAIADAVAKLFTHRFPSLEGFRLNHCRLEFAQILGEGDGIRHGLLRYRVKVQPNA